jgi:thioredoxin 1
MLPAIEDVAAEYSGEAKIVKVNIDDSPVTRDAYGIKGIPAFLIFSKGEVTDRFLGGTTRSTLGTAIEKQLGGAS